MQLKKLERVVVISAFPAYVKIKTEQMQGHMKDEIHVELWDFEGYEKFFEDTQENPLFGSGAETSLYGNTAERLRAPLGKDKRARDNLLRSTLFLADTEEVAAGLQNGGAYVACYEHERNQGTPLTAAEYVFSGLEELEAEDLQYVWNRVTGQPCEILQTERLEVRETTVEDVDAFYKIYADHTITRYMEPLFEDPEEEKAYQKMYIRNVYGLYGYGVWTVLEKASGEIIGRAGVAPREGCEEPEIGFVIGTRWQRKGYAFEVCSAILKYVQEEFSIDKVISVVHKDNKASIALTRKLGFMPQERILQENHITFCKDLQSHCETVNNR